MAGFVGICMGFALEGVDGANFGVTPANPAFQTLRVTAIDLAGKPNTKISDEIRDDRQISDLILVGQNTDGGFSADLFYHLIPLQCVRVSDLSISYDNRTDSKIAISDWPRGNVSRVPFDLLSGRNIQRQEGTLHSWHS